MAVLVVTSFWPGAIGLWEVATENAVTNGLARSEVLEDLLWAEVNTKSCGELVGVMEDGTAARAERDDSSVLD